MKSRLIVLLIISVVLMSGCVSDDNILNMAKNSPTIQEFLSDYPNAEINLQSMKKADVERDSDFNSQCTNVQAGDYYKVVITDISSGLKALAFVDKDTGVVCAFKEGTETCTESWSCTDWSPETCPSTETQTRTCTDSNNCETTDSKPDETRTCTYVPPQTECTESWSCTDWSDCNDETQTRTCTDANSCGTTDSKPSTSQTCSMECTESWSCSAWSDCSNSVQTRTCTDSNICGTTANKPTISQSCTAACTESWSCTDWSDCTDSIQTRTCTDANSCGTISNKPAVSQSCSPGCTSHYEYKCYENDVWWYDSCGNREGVKVGCTSTSFKCENGECVSLNCAERGWSVCPSIYECIGNTLSGLPDASYPSICCDGTCGSTITCQEAGYTLCPDEDRCSGQSYSSSDSTTPQVCCKGTCDSRPTCSEASGYICSSGYKCTGDTIDAYDSSQYAVCCSQECEPKTCAEIGKNSCEVGYFCRVYNSAYATRDMAAGQVCCSDACEAIPECGNDVCEFGEDKSPTTFTMVDCLTGTIENPIVKLVTKNGGCQISGCTADCG